MARRLDPKLVGKVFEQYAWSTVRRNYPRWQGWVRFEQVNLPSGLRPDNVLLNEETGALAVVEMKDVQELTESHIRKVSRYIAEVREMAEGGEVDAFLPIAWDTEVSRRVRRIARKEGVTIRRTSWRRRD